ncbi:hypothetical protein R1flu_010642 [Riccia fluitans]|uniref:Uncharacterized protein n=1 Tax=Riccia fluitans TaxID=41844 RepID=A0ABD1Z6B3_9MARC
MAGDNGALQPTRILLTSHRCKWSSEDYAAEDFGREAYGGRTRCGARSGSLCVSWHSSDMQRRAGLPGWILESDNY